MTDKAVKVAAAKSHYLSLPGRTESGYEEVMRDPRKFNRVWRYLLKLPPSDEPPPEFHSTRCSLLMSCASPCRPTADPARLDRLTQIPNRTLPDLGIGINCEWRY